MQKNFVVYKSGAGSGKTFTLVKEYLRLALHDPQRLQQNYRRILAVTFTNKAASEMKSRVIESLDIIARSPGENAMAKMLCDEMKIGQEELRRRAGIVLSHLLHHYSDFAIGTIDSFTHKIVRTFAQELDLPVNFSVEIDAESFYHKVISQLLAKVGEDEEVSRLLKDLVMHRAEENAAWDPEGSMQEFTSLLLKENAPAYLEKLAKLDQETLEKAHGKLVRFIKEYRSRMKDLGKEAVDLIHKAGLSDEDFFSKGTGPQRFFYKCARGDAEPEDAKGSRLQAAIGEGKWQGKGPGEKSVAALAPSLTRIAKQLVEHIETNGAHYTACELLSKQMYGLMLLQKIEALSREQKQEERIVFISEFNNRIFDLVNEEPAPFIYERLGERYHHYLLDEFQDTSSLQWFNLLPLLDNSLANGWYNLVVGDGKQSIYRWRNANVKQFSALPALQGENNAVKQERQQALQRNYEAKVLDVNYRSTSTIVEFNNGLFKAIADKLDLRELQTIYEGHAQKIVSRDEGYVSVHTGRLPSDELEPYNCRHVLEHIRNAVADGFLHGDICVLARKNAQGNTIADFLVRNGVPVVSSDSLLLRNNLEVNTLLAYLRIIVNAADHVSAAVLIGYLRHTGAVDTRRFDALMKRLTGGEWLGRILEEAGIPYPETSSARNLSGHCIALSKALGMNLRAPQYLRFFLDEVNEFLVQKNANIAAFLEWWEIRQKNASLVIPQGTDAVRIMTIHASKGLEFPVVIVPFCNWPVFRNEQTWVNLDAQKLDLPVGVIRLSKKAGGAGFAAELEEEQQQQVLDNVNLLYVAFTRAVSRLHVLAAASAGNTAALVSEWVSGFAGNGNQSGGAIVFGRRGPAVRHENRSAAESLVLEPLQFDGAESVVRIKRSVPLRHPAGQAIGHGVLMHELISRIATPDDLAAVLNAAMLRGQIAREDREAVRVHLTAILNLPELRPLFEAHTSFRAEAELITAGGEVLRPDRVVETATEIVVIDYKTGKENLGAHSAQLKKYADAISGLSEKPIRKLIVYLDTLHVVTVP